MRSLLFAWTNIHPNHNIEYIAPAMYSSSDELRWQKPFGRDICRTNIYGRWTSILYRGCTMGSFKETLFKIFLKTGSPSLEILLNDFRTRCVLYENNNLSYCINVEISCHCITWTWKIHHLTNLCDVADLGQQIFGLWLVACRRQVIIWISAHLLSVVRKQSSVQFEAKYKAFLSEKFILNCRLQSIDHFAQATMCGHIHLVITSGDKTVRMYLSKVYYHSSSSLVHLNWLAPPNVFDTLDSPRAPLLISYTLMKW